MSKKHYAVIGHPIGHTMSPFINKRLFELSGIDAEYTKLDIPPEKLEEEFASTLKGLDGFNVTIPHKQAVIKLLDEIDDKARMYGSVNTVLNSGGRSKGFTTDPDGFISALNAAGISLDGRIVIVGCGGVARTMAYEAALRNKPLEFAVRKEDAVAAGLLCLDITKKIPGAEVSFCFTEGLMGEVDLLINATPVGMFPNTSAQPVSDCAIRRSKNVFDAVYNPLDTVLVRKARANGSNAVGGMSMLVWQAAVAHEKWDGSVYDKTDIERLCVDAANKLKEQ